MIPSSIIIGHKEECLQIIGVVYKQWGEFPRDYFIMIIERVATF